MRPIESKERTSMRQLQNLPRHRRFHRNRPTCFAKIGATLVGRHRRCRRFNEVLQLPLVIIFGSSGINAGQTEEAEDLYLYADASHTQIFRPNRRGYNARANDLNLPILWLDF